jgi:SAM-dependent methyltransferase
VDGGNRYAIAQGWPSLDAILDAYPEGLRIDLGCGFVKPPGFIGLDNLVGAGVQDVDVHNGPDILIDLNAEPLPFPAASCIEARSSHFLEHSNLDHVICEVHRVLAPGSTFRFAVPYANSADGMFPGHTIFLTEKFFRLNRTFQDRFEIVEERFRPTEDYLALPRLVRALIPPKFARTFLFNAFGEMTIVARRRP